MGAISDRLIHFFTSHKQEEFSSAVFIKALQIFTIVKVVTLYFTSRTFDVTPNFAPQSIISKTLLLPGLLALYDFPLFILSTLVVLVIAVLVRPGYIINGIFFWIVLNLFRLKFPVVNGSDIVLAVLSLYSIALVSGKTRFDHLTGISETALFNTSRLLIQVQVLLIYLISGWDKLQSGIWRTGEAFAYIPHLDVFFNPWFAQWFQEKSWQLIFAWVTILFELLFIVLVYAKRPRLWILGVGVVFHLIIWLMFNLPDFALMMILSYLIFLKDADYQWIRTRFRRSPP